MRKPERKKLTPAELDQLTVTFPTWVVKDGRLCKTYKFKGFREALGWMVSVGLAAEKLDHHPEWSNVYNRVDVALTTHDMSNQISTWDVALAKIMDELAGH